jgi:putative membrane protein
MRRYALLILPPLTATACGYGGYRGGMHGPGGGHMWFEWLFWGLLIVLAVLGVSWLLRRNSGQSPPDVGRGPKESPLDIAKRRYAAGEISQEEYEQLKKDLG